MELLPMLRMTVLSLNGDSTQLVTKQERHVVVSLSVSEIDRFWKLPDISSSSRTHRRLYISTLIGEWLSKNHRLAVVWDTTNIYKDLYAMYQSFKNVCDREYPQVTMFLDRRFKKAGDDPVKGYVIGKAHHTGGKVADDHQSYVVYMINNAYDRNLNIPRNPNPTPKEQESKRLYLGALRRAKSQITWEQVTFDDIRKELGH